MPGYNDAIRVFRELLGEANVKTEPSEISEYEVATFPTEQRVPVVLFPRSTQEVSEIVRAANQYKVPIYPISRGRNWGLGSRVPVKNGNCIVDLCRMDEIVEFDERLSYITVRPGTTFRQVADYLEERNSDLYLSMIGGPPESSLIGNAIERGDAIGPMGEKAKFCCGIEAVLPTGEIVNCSNEAFSNSLTGKLCKFGLGPDIESLFFQSNFGIITKMTFWLAKKPERFQSIIFGIQNIDDLQEVVFSIRRLNQKGVIKDSSFTIWNVFRVLASQMRYPWDENGMLRSSPTEVLEHLPSGWRGIKWVGMIGLYSASVAHARADKKMVKAVLRGKVSKLFVIDAFSAKLIRLFSVPLKKISNINIGNLINSLYYESICLGNPQNGAASTVYWRKRKVTSSVLDPDRDRCGVHWICISLPFDGTHVARVGAMVERVSVQYSFEPQYMFWSPNQWSLKSFIIIVYDRDIEGEDQRALDCYRNLYLALYDAGYTPNRIGIQSMDTVAPDQQSYIDLIARIKKLFDPNDILAPGRYDFRHRWRD